MMPILTCHCSTQVHNPLAYPDSNCFDCQGSGVLREGQAMEISEERKCDMCTSRALFDARTSLGPWASLCKEHFLLHGVGLGTGSGQRLILVPTPVSMDMPESKDAKEWEPLTGYPHLEIVEGENIQEPPEGKKLCSWCNEYVTEEEESEPCPWFKPLTQPHVT